MSHNVLKELAGAVERHVPSDGGRSTQISRLSLYRSSEPTVSHEVVYQPSLCVVVQGAKEVTVGGEAYRYDPAQSLLVSIDMPATTRVVDASPKRPCLAVVIRISAADVDELLADGADAPPGGSPARGIGVTPVEPRLLDAINRLVTLLDSPQEIAVLSPLVLREVTYRVLTGPQGARLRQVAAPGTPTQRIAGAIGWLRDHFAEPVRIDEVARQVGLSQSSFHQHFKAVTGLSPLQYQKRFRLQEARRLMLSEGLDAAEAGFSVGYESPSQFGREYRRLFGAPPRQDIAALSAP